VTVRCFVIGSLHLYRYVQQNSIASIFSMSSKNFLDLVFTFESRYSNHCRQCHGKICQSTDPYINDSKFCFLHSPVFIKLSTLTRLLFRQVAYFIKLIASFNVMRESILCPQEAASYPYPEPD